MKNLEQELKLKLDEREFGILAEMANTQPQLQVNYYFVCPRLPQDMMVRIREKNGVFHLGFKYRIQQNQSVTVCDERECEISADFAQSLVRRGILPEEINDMLHTDFFEVLTCAGKLETYRTEFDFEEWHLELDKNQYLGITDYELECESNYVQQLYKLKNYLVYRFGIVLKDSAPKSQRFFEAKNGKI